MNNAFLTSWQIITTRQMTKRLIPVSAVIILSLILISCSEAETQEKKIIRPVVYEEVGFQGGESQRTFNGTAETEKSINLSFRSSGIITLLDMNVGQMVQRGDLLARLDNVQARLGYEQAVSAMNSAESQLQTANLNYNRVRSLYEKGSASLSDFENAKNSQRTAENSLESAKRSVDIQQEQINYGFIYAPEDGVIASVNAEPDETVSPGQTISVLNAGSRKTINVGIPESIINYVREDASVGIQFPALGSQIFEGVVTEVSPTVSRSTSTYPVQVGLMGESDNVRAGMAANVTFNFRGQGESSLVVPAKSVGEDSRGRFVFLVVETGDSLATVQKQRIEVGELTSIGFQVVDGLTAGQKIATAGLQTLIDGQEVLLNYPFEAQ